MFDQTTSEIKEKIRKQFAGINNLPAIPHIITEVTQLLDDEKTSAADLCRVIAKDQALATKILAVANSPLYGLPRRVATIEFAIVIIGFEHIRNILLALSLLDTLRVRKNPDWNHNEYWTHSLIVATGAKKIADDLRYPKSGEVFTVGLLHDMGLVILYKYLNSEFKKIVKLVRDEGISYREAEKIILGYTHADIAEFLLERWNFPPYIVDAVVNHHHPSMADKNPVLASLIHLVDYMTYKLGIGNFTWDMGFELDENIIDVLGFGNNEYLEEFINSYEELFKWQIESLN